MIAARIGLDRFLVWRLPLAKAIALLPPGPPPVAEDGHAWLLFAAARLERLRVAGCPLPATQVAAWLIPCTLANGAIGNAFLAGFSDRRLPAWTMGRLGIPRTRRVAIAHDEHRLEVAGEAAAEIGADQAVPGLEWFARDRCGLVPGTSRWRRLPLTKRSWAWRARQAVLRADFADSRGAEPLCAIDCSGDDAVWSLPRSGSVCPESSKVGQLPA